MKKRPLIGELRELLDQGVEFEIIFGAFLAHFRVRPILVNRIKVAQKRDRQLCRVIYNVHKGQAQGFMLNDDGVLHYGTRLCVPRVDELR